MRALGHGDLGQRIMHMGRQHRHQDVALRGLVVQGVHVEGLDPAGQIADRILGGRDRVAPDCQIMSRLDQAPQTGNRGQARTTPMYRHPITPYAQVTSPRKI